MKEETYKLSPEGTHIVQQPEMIKPDFYKWSSGTDSTLFYDLIDKYEAHIASLKTYPISGIVPESWKGKDYEIGRNEFEIVKNCMSEEKKWTANGTEYTEVEWEIYCHTNIQPKEMKVVVEFRVNTTKDLTDLYPHMYEGSSILVKSETKEFYNGIWPSSMGSYTVTVPKKYCVKSSFPMPVQPKEESQQELWKYVHERVLQFQNSNTEGTKHLYSDLEQHFSIQRININK